MIDVNYCPICGDDVSDQDVNAVVSSIECETCEKYVNLEVWTYE